MDKRIKRIHQELELLTKAYANVKYDQHSTLTLDKGDIQIIVEFPEKYPFLAPTISDFKMQQDYNPTLHVVDIMDTMFSAPTRILILCHKKIVTGYLGDSLILNNHFYGRPLGSDESYLFNELFLPYFKNRGKVNIDTVDIDEGGTFQADAFSDEFIGKHLKWYDLILVPDCQGPWVSLQYAEDLNPFFQLCLNVTKMLKPNGIIHFGKFADPRAVNGIEYESCAPAVVSFLQKNGFTATLDVHDDLYSGTIGQYIIAQKNPVVPLSKPSKADFYNVEVEADGNCFFYACWESARLQGITVLNDLILDKMERYKVKTTANALATDSFPVADRANPDKLQTVVGLLKGLDELISTKLHWVDERTNTDTVLETVSENVNSSIINPQRYNQQKAFAWFMRKLLASSKEYKESLEQWKNFMIELYGTGHHDAVEQQIDEMLTAQVSIHYYDYKLSVPAAIQKFVQAMPNAFSNNSYMERLWVSQLEINALTLIFHKIGLNLNLRFTDPIDPKRPTLFVILGDNHYTAAIPRRSNFSIPIPVQQNQLDFVNDYTKHMNIKIRQEQSWHKQEFKRARLQTRNRARAQWFRSGGRNRTKKHKKCGHVP